MNTTPAPRARHEIHDKVNELVAGLGSAAGKRALDAPLGGNTIILLGRKC